MAYEGHVDILNDLEIAGWVYDSSRRDEPIPVEILAGDELLASLKADGFRQDLLDAGKGNGRHAFRFRRSAPSGQAAPLSVRVAGKRWRIQHTAADVLSPVHQDPRRLYQHSLEFGFPRVPHGFTQAESSDREEDLVSRIIRAYRLAEAEKPREAAAPGDMWSDLQAAYHGEALALIHASDVRGLAAYLREAHAKGITVGVSQGPAATNALRTDPEIRLRVLTQFVDYLASLAEFLGLMDVEAPDQEGPFGENLHADADRLVERISRHVGIPLEPPPVIGANFGIRTPGGILSGRDLCSLYAALRLRDLAIDAGVASPRVCEIGGGVGGVAYYGALLGGRFTIVDLPIIGVLQAYYLQRALPDHEIRLHGEDVSPSTAIRLAPTFRFADQPGGVDFLFNQDSIPEMSARHAREYLRHAREMTRHGFLSINQEARALQSGAQQQSVVRELVDEAGGFRRATRHRHWLRAGYVEELYRPTAPAR